MALFEDNYSIAEPFTEDSPLAVPDLAGRLVLCLFYNVIFCFGVVGNMLTIAVITRTRYLHSNTNFYLCSLAVSDLLMLVFGLPFEVVSVWLPELSIGGQTFCILRPLIAETATNASVITIGALTLDRWLAISKPLRVLPQEHAQPASFRQTLKVLIILWFLSVLTAVPLVIQFGMQEYDRTWFCTVVWQIPYVYTVSSVCFFVVPIFGLLILYGSMMTDIRMKMSTNGAVGNKGLLKGIKTRISIRQQAQATRAVLRMLIAVVSAFFLCFLPYHVQRVLTEWLSNEDQTRHRDNLQIFYSISGFFYYLSGTINPMLYNLMSQKFRRAFKDLVLRRSRNSRRPIMRWKFTNTNSQS